MTGRFPATDAVYTDAGVGCELERSGTLLGTGDQIGAATVETAWPVQLETLAVVLPPIQDALFGLPFTDRVYPVFGFALVRRGWVQQVEAVFAGKDGTMRLAGDWPGAQVRPVGAILAWPWDCD